MCKIKISFEKNELFNSNFLFKKLNIILKDQLNLKTFKINDNYIFYLKKPIYFFDTKIISEFLFYHIKKNNKITQLVIKNKKKYLFTEFFIINDNYQFDVNKINNYYFCDNNSIVIIDNYYILNKLQKKIFYQTCIFHINNGVNIIDINSTYIDINVKINKNTVIFPNCNILGQTIIGDNNIIGPNTLIDNCIIGNFCNINNSCVYNSNLKNYINIGPYSHIRPGCFLSDNVKIGNFVELKKSIIEEKTKISHLTYIGDAEIGKNVNFGCGCITVNYDGKNKHQTKINNNSFIGCNVNIIAPINIGKNVYIAAGTTITKDIPDNSFSIGRIKQENKKKLKP